MKLQKTNEVGWQYCSFEIKGIEAGRNFWINKTMFVSPNLGDTRTIVTHPASTTHSKLSVDWIVSITGLVRVSVGLETVKDITDLEQALS
jgi:O-succinylhomoserine sulfhydrylase